MLQPLDPYSAMGASVNITDSSEHLKGKAPQRRKAITARDKDIFYPSVLPNVCQGFFNRILKNLDHKRKNLKIYQINKILDNTYIQIYTQYLNHNA